MSGRRIIELYLARRTPDERMVCMRLLLLIPALVLAAGCERSLLDQQMESLCRNDGGVVINETVKLPAAEFDATGRVIARPFVSEADGVWTQIAGDSYRIQYTTIVIKEGNPFSGFFSEGQLVRYVTAIHRVPDKKLMGVEVSYGRTGGEIALGHPSQSYCPNPRVSPGVVEAVFLKAK